MRGNGNRIGACSSEDCNSDVAILEDCRRCGLAYHRSPDEAPVADATFIRHRHISKAEPCAGERV